MYLSRHEAARRLNRHPTVIRDWDVRGHLRVARLDDCGRPLYDARDVLACARMMNEKYLNRTFVAGSGRGNIHPATDEIRQRIIDGEGTKEIAEAVGCSLSTVTKNRRRLRAAQDAPGPPQNTFEGDDTRKQ